MTGVVERKQSKNGVGEIWEVVECQRRHEPKRGCLDLTRLKLLDDLNERSIN